MAKDVEMKFAELDVKTITEEGEFEGYASRFDVRDQGGDSVSPGAFKKSLKSSGSRVKMLWQHDPSSPIGSWSELKEDGVGLRVRGKLLTSLVKGKEVYDMMKAGIIDGLSIGYRTIVSTRDDKTGFRELKELDLWEISLVTFPMLTSATVTAVKDDGWTKRSVERVLRDAGMPNAMAVKVVAGGFDAANSAGQREADSGTREMVDTIRQMTENLQRRL